MILMDLVRESHQFIYFLLILIFSPSLLLFSPIALQRMISQSFFIFLNSLCDEVPRPPRKVFVFSGTGAAILGILAAGAGA